MSASTALALLRGFGILGLTSLCLPLALFFRLIIGRTPFWVSRFWHSGVLTCCGCTVRLFGDEPMKAPGFVIANHLSWLDICALGAHVPGYFIARADMAKWPVLGIIARASGCFFIERKPALAYQQIRKLKKTNRGKNPWIVFPEGTSSDGRRVLPLKSAILQLALDSSERTNLQLVSSSCSFINGWPAHSSQRHVFCWYGDTDFASHFWRVLKTRRMTLDLYIHKPVQAQGERKSLARALHTVLEDGVAFLRIRTLIRTEPMAGAKRESPHSAGNRADEPPAKTPSR